MSKHVYKKLGAAVAGAGHLEKKGYNAHHKYHYVRESDLLDVLNRQFSEHGLVVTPAIKGFNVEDGVTYVHMLFTIADVESGDHIELPWAGSDMDKMGKGVPKAVTNATKTFYLKLLRASEEADEQPKPNPQRPAIPPPTPAPAVAKNPLAAQLKAVSKALADLKGGKPSEHLRRVSEFEGSYIDNPDNPRFAEKDKWFEVTIERIKKEIKEHELAQVGEQTKANW